MGEKVNLPDEAWAVVDGDLEADSLASAIFDCCLLVMLRMKTCTLGLQESMLFFRGRMRRTAYLIVRLGGVMRVDRIMDN